jgi:hypothetical protein
LTPLGSVKIPIIIAIRIEITIKHFSKLLIEVGSSFRWNDKDCLGEEGGDSGLRRNRKNKTPASFSMAIDLRFQRRLESPNTPPTTRVSFPRKREPPNPQHHICHPVIIGSSESWNPKLNFSSNNIDPEGGRMFIETT